MKNFILFVAILIGFTSCSTTDDDTGNICTDNCTTIKGRFLTGNNTPLKGIGLTLEFKTSNPPLGSNTRIISKTQTDENGYYKMVFFLEESEIGNSRGYFSLLLNETNLNPQKFIRNNNIYTGALIFSIPTRDTIIDKSFYIPRKEYITVTLTDFLPVVEDDFFNISIYYPYGLKIGPNDLIAGEYQAGSSGFGKYFATNPVQTFDNVIVAQNELNKIKIGRRKNGVTTYEDVEIFVPANNNIELTFQY